MKDKMRLSIDVSLEDHKKLKTYTAKHGISIRELFYCLLREQGILKSPPRRKRA